jgi:hypothetical protein
MLFWVGEGTIFQGQSRALPVIFMVLAARSRGPKIGADDPVLPQMSCGYGKKNSPRRENSYIEMS